MFSSSLDDYIRQYDLSMNGGAAKSALAIGIPKVTHSRMVSSPTPTRQYDSAHLATVWRALPQAHNTSGLTFKSTKDQKCRASADSVPSASYIPTVSSAEIPHSNSNSFMNIHPNISHTSNVAANPLVSSLTVDHSLREYRRRMHEIQPASLLGEAYLLKRPSDSQFDPFSYPRQYQTERTPALVTHGQVSLTGIAARDHSNNQNSPPRYINNGVLLNNPNLLSQFKCPAPPSLPVYQNLVPPITIMPPVTAISAVSVSPLTALTERYTRTRHRARLNSIRMATDLMSLDEGDGDDLDVMEQLEFTDDSLLRCSDDNLDIHVHGDRGGNVSDHYIRRERADSYIHPTHYTQLAALNDSRADVSMTTETNEDLYDESLGDETLLEIENIELMPDANFTTKIHGVPDRVVEQPQHKSINAHVRGSVSMRLGERAMDSTCVDKAIQQCLELRTRYRSAMLADHCVEPSTEAVLIPVKRASDRMCGVSRIQSISNNELERTTTAATTLDECLLHNHGSDVRPNGNERLLFSQPLDIGIAISTDTLYSKSQLSLPLQSSFEGSYYGNDLFQLTNSPTNIHHVSPEPEGIAMRSNDGRIFIDNATHLREARVSAALELSHVGGSRLLPIGNHRFNHNAALSQVMASRGCVDADVALHSGSRVNFDPSNMRVSWPTASTAELLLETIDNDLDLPLDVTSCSGFSNVSVASDYTGTRISDSFGELGIEQQIATDEISNRLSCANAETRTNVSNSQLDKKSVVDVEVLNCSDSSVLSEMSEWKPRTAQSR